MAIQFARIEIVGRSSGGNACCKGAYNARAIVKDNKTKEKEHKEKLLKVEDDKKDRVKELMSSDKPEAEIAEALKGLLK